MPWRGRHLVARLQALKDNLVVVKLRPLHALDHLAPRKREAAVLFAHGASQAQVARRLGLSESTINNYLGDVYRRMEVSDKGQLATAISRLPD